MDTPGVYKIKPQKKKILEDYKNQNGEASKLHQKRVVHFEDYSGCVVSTDMEINLSVKNHINADGTNSEVELSGNRAVVTSDQSDGVSVVINALANENNVRSNTVIVQPGTVVHEFDSSAIVSPKSTLQAHIEQRRFVEKYTGLPTSYVRKRILTNNVKYIDFYYDSHERGEDMVVIDDVDMSDIKCHDHDILLKCGPCKRFLSNLILDDNKFPHKGFKMTDVRTKNIFHVAYSEHPTTTSSAVETFGLARQMNGWYESYVLDNKGQFSSIGTDTPYLFDSSRMNDPGKYFFGLYTQSERRHLCTSQMSDIAAPEDLTVIRESEIHRRPKDIRKIPFRMYKLSENRYQIIIFSYEEDIVFKPTCNQFWTRENTLIRLAKSVDGQYNFALATLEALDGMEIYGAYYFQIVTVGRRLAKEPRYTALKAGSAILHRCVVNNQHNHKPGGKVNSAIPMEEAERLLNKKRKDNKP